MRTPHAFLAATAAASLLLGSFGPAWAEGEDVGSVVGAQPKAEIGRAKAWSEAAAGAGVRMADELRTDAGGRLKVVFKDESVLNLGSDTLVVVDQAVYDAGGSFRSVFDLIKGKLRAVVSEYYADPLAVYQVTTPNAVSGVRGTDFIISYDPARKLTEVVCLTGTVAVHNRNDLKGPGVLCRPGSTVRVERDRYPSDPVSTSGGTLGEKTKETQVEDEGVAAGQDPIFGGSAVPDEDKVGEGKAPNKGGAPVAPKVEVPGDNKSTPGAILNQPAGSGRDKGDVIIDF